jgi:hypothetical protein
MEETRSIVFTIIVGDRPYLYEGRKLSNLKHIQTIFFHLLCFFTMSIIILRNSMSYKNI